MNGKLKTGIVSSTIPNELILGVTMGITFINEYAIQPTFFKNHGVIEFQAAVKIYFVNKANSKRQFEFITATDFEIDKTIDDEGFYDLTHSNILTAISDFNRQIKETENMFLTGKSYTGNPSFEDNKEAVRKAWTLYQFNARTSNN